MPKEGNCCICGIYGPLSFEHVPPRSAFNDKLVVKARFDDVVGLGPDAIIKGKAQQQGAGDYTLCPRCNNNTGSWYGKDFVDWCYQGYEILTRTRGQPSIIYLNYLFPLRIVKQIITMFFSINGSGFADANPELVKFVLNRDFRYISPKYRLFVYFSIGRLARSSGVSALVNINTQKTCIFSEMNYFPYGYVLTLNSHPPDRRLIEISHFARFGYKEFAIMELRLPVLPTYLYFPGDYRTKEQILADRLKAEKTVNPEEFSKK